MGAKKTKEEDHAKILYLDTKQTFTNREIAARVGVQPSTIADWIKKGKWEGLRKSLMVTRKKMIIDLYDQLNNLNNHINTRPIIYDIPANLLKGQKLKDKGGNETLVYPKYNQEDYPIKSGNFATPKEANSIAVITTSIKRLETEISIAEVYEVATGFLEYIKPQDLELYKQLIPLFDAFINSKVD